MHYLYKITNTINGKIYIGQTTQPIGSKSRWAQHKTAAKAWSKGTGKNLERTLAIDKAIAKYGHEIFTFELIASCLTQDDANDLETLLVKQYDCHVSNGKGYNVTFGGMNAPKTDEWRQMMRDWHASLSPEERAEISRKQSEATQLQIIEKGHPAAGRIVTEEEKELHRKTRLENPLEYTEELRQKMSEAHIGIKDSEETKQNKSESAKGAWEKRIDYSRKCSASGCDVSGKAKYKIIDGVRYCNKHGLRMLRYGRLDCLSD